MKNEDELDNCDFCGKMSPKDQIHLQEHSGMLYCEKCLRGLTECDNCGEMLPGELLYPSAYSGEFYCESCLVNEAESNEKFSKKLEGTYEDLKRDDADVAEDRRDDPYYGEPREDA